MNALFVAFLAVVACVAAAPVSEEPIAILSQESEVNPDGSFNNKWESANGISVQEEGSVKPLEKDEVAQVIKGSATWTAPDGTQFHMTWVADDNGFQPQGEHIPTPPPTPEAILKALAWSDSHPYDEKAELAKKH